jgi:hypothetical protein
VPPDSVSTVDGPLTVNWLALNVPLEIVSLPPVKLAELLTVTAPPDSLNVPPETANAVPPPDTFNSPSLALNVPPDRWNVDVLSSTLSNHAA